MNVAELRTYDPNRRPPGMTNHYCPRCSCRKNGYADEANGRDESCTDDDCACHNETLLGAAVFLTLYSDVEDTPDVSEFVADMRTKREGEDNEDDTYDFVNHTDWTRGALPRCPRCGMPDLVEVEMNYGTRVGCTECGWVG